MKESDIQRLILDWLAANRIWHIRLNAGAMFGSYKGKKWAVRFGRPGQADILVIKHHGSTCHRVIWIEVKNEKGKQSAAQEAFEREVNQQGHYYILARSLEDVTALLG